MAIILCFVAAKANVSVLEINEGEWNLKVKDKPTQADHFSPGNL